MNILSELCYNEAIVSVVYLDNSATSWPKPACVGTAMSCFLAEEAGNPGRGGHRLAVACERMLDRLRTRLHRLFDGASPQRTIFTLNTTDALNIAIKGVLRPGDHVVTTTLEHNSVSRPLQAMADAGTLSLTRVPADADGFIVPADIAGAIEPNTRLIAIAHAGNVLGTIQPLEAIGRIAREHRALLLVDAAQSAGLVPLSMREMGIDLLAVAGHKTLLGPPGTGALLVGEGVELAPWREGGTGGDSAHATQPDEYPWHLEAGTPNTVGLAGWAAALEEIERLGSARMLEHERDLAMQFADAFAGHDGVRIFGPADYSRRTGLALFTLAGTTPQEVAAILDESFGIAVRAGLHCAPYLHQALGTFPDGAVRVSPGPYTTSRDIALLIDAVGRICDHAAWCG